MDPMNKFVEICQEATQCMRYPQEAGAGWFLWIVWGIIIVTVAAGFVGSWQIRRYVWASLKDPTEYRGRVGRDEFLLVYFGLQTLRAMVVVGCVIGVAFLGKQPAGIVVILAGLVLLGWISAALYSAIVRRGHDFDFDGKESLGAYFWSRPLRRTLLRKEGPGHTWHVMCNQKGNPYANRFGSAPEENNYLIPPEKDWQSTHREFPSVWDEADWKSMQRQPERKLLKRSHWKRDDK